MCAWRLCVVLFLCLILVHMPAEAAETTGTLAGIVAGPDGARLPGTMVTVQSSNDEVSLQVTTNASGMYRIPDLKPGTYNLSAALRGFETLSVPGVEIAPAANLTMDLNLKIVPLQITVDVITLSNRDSMEASVLRESSARDVGEAIEEIPGVYKVRKAGIANDFVIRGFQSKDTNVLIDGERIYGACPNSMDPPAFHVDFAEVDRVEISKGPFDMKNHGSLGGVVNIVTRDATPGLHASANMSAGSYGFVNPAASVEYGGEAASFLAGYSYRRSSPYTDGNGIRFTELANYRPADLDSDAFRANTVWGKLAFNPRNNHLARISYTHQQADHVLYPYLKMDADYDDTDRIHVGYQLDNLAGPVSSVSVQAYYTKVSHWMTDEYRASSIGFPLPYMMGTWAGTKATGGKFETKIRRVTVGVEGFRRDWDAATHLAGRGYAPQYSVPGVRTDSIGVYSEYEKPLTDSLRLTVGGRYDAVSMDADAAKANTDLYFAYNSTESISATDHLPSGSAHFSYAAPFGITFSGGIGHTVRVPDARERYFALSRMGTDWVGNPSLEPSRNTGLDGTLMYRRNSLLLESDFFLDYVDNYVAVVRQVKTNSVSGVMNSNSRSYLNVDARMYGTEFLASYIVRKQVFLSGNLSYVRGTRDALLAEEASTVDLAEIPPLRISTALRYDTGKYSLEIESVLTGKQSHVDTSLDEEPTPGYGIINLRGSAHIKNLVVHAALNNLFDRAYFEHLSYQRDPFSSGTRVYEPGRNVYINLSFRY